MSNESTDSKQSETNAIVPGLVRHETGSLGDNKGTIAQGGNATLNDRLGVYIAIVALLVAGMGLGYEIAQSGSRAEIRQLQEQAIDASIKAGIAKAEAEANEAKVNARVALDKVEDMRAKLAEQHIKIGPLDGH